MENITIVEIDSTLKLIAGIIGSLTVIFAIFSKWYKKKITNKFDVIDNKFEEVEKRLDYVESKRDEYEHEVENSNCERMILMEGLLAALKGLHEMGCNDAVTTSIKRIEDYMMKKTHGQEGSL